MNTVASLLLPLDSYLEVDGGSDNAHGLGIVPQHAVGAETALPPVIQLLQPRHATLADLLWKEVVFRYLLEI